MNRYVSIGLVIFSLVIYGLFKYSKEIGERPDDVFEQAIGIKEKKDLTKLSDSLDTSLKHAYEPGQYNSDWSTQGINIIGDLTKRSENSYEKSDEILTVFNFKMTNESLPSGASLYPDLTIGELANEKGSIIYVSSVFSIKEGFNGEVILVQEMRQTNNALCEIGTRKVFLVTTPRTTKKERNIFNVFRRELESSPLTCDVRLGTGVRNYLLKSYTPEGISLPNLDDEKPYEYFATLMYKSRLRTYFPITLQKLK